MLLSYPLLTFTHNRTYVSMSKTDNTNSFKSSYSVWPLRHLGPSKTGCKSPKISYRLKNLISEKLDF